MVDWPAVQARLREQGIVLVGGGADEAPEVYKRLPEAAAHAGSIRVKHTLRPLGVAMAGLRPEGRPPPMRTLRCRLAGSAGLLAAEVGSSGRRPERSSMTTCSARRSSLSSAGRRSRSRLAPLETSSARASFAAQSVIPIDRPPGAEEREPAAKAGGVAEPVDEVSRKVRSPSTMLSGGPAKVVKRATAGVSCSRVGSVSSSPMKSSYRSTPRARPRRRRPCSRRPRVGSARSARATPGCPRSS